VASAQQGSDDMSLKVRIPKELSARQKKAMNEELQNQIAESLEGLTSNIVAVVLWELRQQKGWGKKQLLDFHGKFVQTLKELQDYYLMHTAQETDFICKYMLKQEVGIDVDALDDILHIQVKYKGEK
jgi:hypothetical protein